MKSSLASQDTSLPAARRSQLNNGLPVDLIELPGARLFSLEVFSPAGSVYDPPALSGLASLCAFLTDEGTANFSVEQINSRVDELGGHLRTTARHETSLLAIGGLCSDLEGYLHLAGEVLTRPTFPPSEVQRAKDRRVTTLRQMAKSPVQLANLASARAVYGSSPYGRSALGDLESTLRMDQDSIVAFFDSHHWCQGSAACCVSGLNEKEVLRTLNATWGAMPLQQEVQPKPLPSFPRLREAVTVVATPASHQTQLRAAWSLPGLSDPDRPALEVATHILAGPHQGLIDQALRDQRGLTYGAHGSLHWRTGSSLLTVSTAVAKARTIEALAVIRQQARQAAEHTVTEVALETAKRSLLGEQMRGYQSMDRLADQLGQIAARQASLEFEAQRAETLLAVSAEACREVAARYLADKAIFTLVGDREALRMQLSETDAVVETSAEELLGVP